jgi:hypothetical protein
MPLVPQLNLTKVLFLRPVVSILSVAQPSTPAPLPGGCAFQVSANVMSDALCGLAALAPHLLATLVFKTDTAGAHSQVQQDGTIRLTQLS